MNVFSITSGSNGSSSLFSLHRLPSSPVFRPRSSRVVSQSAVPLRPPTIFLYLSFPPCLVLDSLSSVQVTRHFSLSVPQAGVCCVPYHLNPPPRVVCPIPSSSCQGNHDLSHRGPGLSQGGERRLGVAGEGGGLAGGEDILGRKAGQVRGWRGQQGPREGLHRSVQVRQERKELGQGEVGRRRNGGRVSLFLIAAFVRWVGSFVDPSKIILWIDSTDCVCDCCFVECCVGILSWRCRWVSQRFPPLAVWSFKSGGYTRSKMFMGGQF